jgi:asparagine synthase (glutamine-hydrolysing)
MCGLAGFVTAESHPLPDSEARARARRMIDILRHRGPDGQYVWSEPGVGLAHARLAIIDTSTIANQPMHEGSGRYHIVFNGEIYNFRAVRRDLEAAGHRFRTQGDTEVILLGYKQWGTGVFERLVGMFAIAIWDSRERRLVLARDRMGEKPLAYAVLPDGFIFGSEIKSLLTWPNLRRRPDTDALHDYLTFGFMLQPGSAFAGIERLPPASFMIVEQARPARVERYWRMPEPALADARDSADLQAEALDHLTRAIEGCLISDVPLGAFLSGGVDSSSVVALMSARCGHRDIETFSSGFGFGDYDETAYADLVARRYQTRHHPFRFGIELLSDVSKLAWHYDEPFADSSALVAFALARETRRNVTVAVTGDGADETFLGYERYFIYGDLMRQGAQLHARKLPRLYRHSTTPEDARRAAVDAYGFMMERFREGQKLRLYDLGLLPHLQKCSYERMLPYFVDCAMPEELAARLDCGVYLPDDLLVKVDIASMAHGLETRAPYLDHRVVEFAASIPADKRIWGREGKALLKKALEPYVPHECLYRTKVGFRVPVAQFIREEARAQAQDLLLSDRAMDRGLVRREAVAGMFEEHCSGKQGHGPRLWALIMLELWHRTWVDGESNTMLSGDGDPFAAFAASGAPPDLATPLPTVDEPALAALE